MARDTIFGGVFWLWDACFLHHTIYLYKEINFKLKISQVKEEQGKTNATKFSQISVVWNTNLKIGCTGMCCSICCKCVVCVFFENFFFVSLLLVRIIFVICEQTCVGDIHYKLNKNDLNFGVSVHELLPFNFCCKSIKLCFLSL